MILLRLFAKTIVYCMIVLMGILLIATTLYLFWASDVFPEVNEFLDNTTAVEMGSGTLGSLGDSASSLLGDAADTANSTLTAIVRLVPDELDQQIAAASVSGDMKTMMQIASWVMLIITLIYIIVICISRRKIVICVTVVKEATKAVKAQPLMMVFPLWMMTAQARAAAQPAASQASPFPSSSPPALLHRPRRRSSSSSSSSSHSSPTPSSPSTHSPTL